MPGSRRSWRPWSSGSRRSSQARKRASVRRRGSCASGSARVSSRRCTSRGRPAAAARASGQSGSGCRSREVPQPGDWRLEHDLVWGAPGRWPAVGGRCPPTEQVGPDLGRRRSPSERVRPPLRPAVNCGRPGGHPIRKRDLLERWRARGHLTPSLKARCTLSWSCVQISRKQLAALAICRKSC